MRIKDVTVGIPVNDLSQAKAWYQNAFSLGNPDQEPLPGLAEYSLGSFWLQLVESPNSAGVEGVSVNIGVDDAAATRQRFYELGLTVTEVQRFDGVVEFFELTDLDGNKIGFVTELS